MWIGVLKRFQQFNDELKLTDVQFKDGNTKHHGVRECLNSHYYGSQSEITNSFLIGSWGKLTQVRPPRDVDLYFELPVEVYNRFQSYSGNKQSALLQEVKKVLQRTYSATDMSGDGQVVIVRFNTINVEVVPAFPLTNGQYYICNTNDGGSYKTTDPKAEEAKVSTVNSAYNYNLRPLVKMAKAWQSYCNVPLKSFHLELVMADYLAQSQWSKNSFFYYDWLLRDFFAYLKTRANGMLFAPGTYEILYLGDAWKSRCDTAYDRAVKACDYERDDYVALAGEEWQKIFGTQIPMVV